MTDDPNKNAKRLIVVSWAVVALLYFYISYDYIRTEMNNDRMGAYVNYVVQLAGNEARTPREVRTLLLVKADELQIPLTADQIKVQGAGQSLKVSVTYDMSINVPIFANGVYSKHYEHNSSYRHYR